MMLRRFVPSVAALVLFACSSDEDPKEIEVEVARSQLPRDTTPTLTPAEQDAMAKGEAEFAVDLFKIVGASKPDDELFLSPHSVSTALVMTYAGARGATAEAMRKTLRFALPDDRLHRAFGEIDLALASRGATTLSGKRPFQLRTANSLWGQTGYRFEAPFLDTLAVNYGAGMNLVDWERASEASRLKVNAWVEQKTESRIKDLLPAGSVDALTRLVLVNAIYFNASWATEFKKEATADRPFTPLDGVTTNVPTMTMTATFPYAKTDAYEAVELPYAGDELALLVIAPTAGTYRTYESALTGGAVLDVMAGLTPTNIGLALPKVKTESDVSLKAPLTTLGMGTAFEGADFSGISTQSELVITDVFHKTFLAIDEEGTEAAAATAAVVAGRFADVGPTPQMQVDRPFLHAIVDRRTKTLLFLGRTLRPKS